ncbi:outer membrane lipid asymmetry maintenance protein MlaD [Neomegalonema sp.]|uniref:outer membrane lipid asymmetry maintenance protein MlaD n=1 Tax=Neomegalonema sp. TaxID=2039713 RepID=UPI00261C1CC9|nr:outer membrane lipid asymmetry maintenance protein MlaD [Neomegalonema sp.]MDD2868211.1 outer membrane lipid asymmetry maintenance protein MlaD [Neomegalonema sp.]
MAENVLEAAVGAAVLAGAIAFAAHVGQRMDGPSNGYALTASFAKADGLTVGGEVRVSGVKVGAVSGIDLDPATYRAEVRLNLRGDLQLPEDSSAKIASDGLLGGAYVSIEPGGDTRTIPAGGSIDHTQGSISILDLVGRAIYGAGGG